MAPSVPPNPPSPQSPFSDAFRCRVVCVPPKLTEEVSVVPPCKEKISLEKEALRSATHKLGIPSKALRAWDRLQSGPSQGPEALHWELFSHNFATLKSSCHYCGCLWPLSSPEPEFGADFRCPVPARRVGLGGRDTHT